MTARSEAIPPEAPHRQHHNEKRTAPAHREAASDKLEGMTQDPSRPFGRLITAMVTPFAEDGSLDADGAAALATYLVDEQRHDALILSGTGGESPTTTDAEKAGAPGLLVVTPYYNTPPQAGLVRHFTTVAHATGLPVMLYDIPHRSGVPIATETLVRVAEHPNIVAVKDAKSDVAATSDVLSRTDLAYYSGEDAGTLPWLSVGAVGVVGTSTHFVGARTKDMIEAYERGDVAAALRLHRQLLPLYTGIFRTQGTILVKAGLRALGLPAGPVRPPLVDATDAELNQLRQDARAAGVDL